MGATIASFSLRHCEKAIEKRPANKPAPHYRYRGRALRLDEDIAYAAQFASDGTLIVAQNGRKAVSFPPFLYALIRTSGLPEPLTAQPAGPSALKESINRSA